MSCAPQKDADDKAAATTASDTTKAKPAPAPAEFADPKYAEMGKKSLAHFSSGDIDGYLADFADNAVYHWNSGDSLAGKAAIHDFWAKRWKEVIDSVSFKNEIWLPIKINKPQATEQPGTWLLVWYQVHAKYKSGKSMTQWMHLDFHFNDADKIDNVIHFRDNTPILAAMKK